MKIGLHLADLTYPSGAAGLAENYAGLPIGF